MIPTKAEWIAQWERAVREQDTGYLAAHDTIVALREVAVLANEKALFVSPELRRALDRLPGWLTDIDDPEGA